MSSLLLDGSAAQDDVEEEEDFMLGFVALYWASSYVDKNPCRTSKLTGGEWVQEILSGNPTRCSEMLRMDARCAFCFLDEDFFDFFFLGLLLEGSGARLASSSVLAGAPPLPRGVLPG